MRGLRPLPVHRALKSPTAAWTPLGNRSQVKHRSQRRRGWGRRAVGRRESRSDPVRAHPLGNSCAGSGTPSPTTPRPSRWKTRGRWPSLASLLPRPLGSPPRPNCPAQSLHTARMSSGRSQPPRIRLSAALCSARTHAMCRRVSALPAHPPHYRPSNTCVGSTRRGARVQGARSYRGQASSPCTRTPLRSSSRRSLGPRTLLVTAAPRRCSAGWCTGAPQGSRP
mmetsp:Transcript_2668/g.6220  ORF Transcript_2668/g.6220 Transcript_2668/m.6220 type:complete len:224 (-) Transcript_2668:361-1032(-)